MRIATILLAIATTLAPAAAQTPSFEGETTVVVVEVPVTVIHDGQPLRDLDASSFRVLEGDEPRELVGFERVELVANDAAATADVPAAARRHFLLLFDIAFTRPQNLPRAVAASRELTAGLHPSDRVGVGVYGLKGGFRLILGFTPDRRQVASVLDALDRLFDHDFDASELKKAEGDNADPLRLVASSLTEVASEIGQAAGFEMTGPLRTLIDGQGDFGYQTEVIIGMHESADKSLVSKRRAEAEAMVGSLGDVAHLTRDLGGSKHLLLFSEGFEDRILGGRDGSGTQKALRQVFELCRRAGWAIQAVDPGGIHTRQGITGTTNSLSMLAHETGGDVYVNAARLDTAMERLLERTSVTYLLAFQTGEIAVDGGFHPLRVELVGAPRGADLRYREGYYAPNPAAEESSTGRLLEVADLLLEGDDGGELDVAALVTPFDDKVTVWLEADGTSLTGGRHKGRLGLEVFVYAFDGQGVIHDHFSRPLDLDLEAQGARLDGGGLKVYGDLDLEPGRYDLRVLVREPDGGRHGLVTVPLEVEDVVPGMRLLPPVVFDDPDRPSLVAYEPDLTSASADHFQVGEQAFLPRVHPALSTDRPARISLMAYRLAEGIRLYAKLLDGGGEPIPGEVLKVAGKAPPGKDGLEQILFDVDPRGLEPGEYTFQVRIEDPAGDVHQRELGFRLVP